jgi:hypothetical protein
VKFKLLLIATLALTSEFVLAQNAWDWEITPYIWAAGIDGTVSLGNAEADISADFSDLVNVLKGGALVKVEATSGKNGIFADIVFLALEEDKAKDTIGGTLEADLDSWIVEGGYRRDMREGFALDFGVRYWDFKTKLTPAILPVVKRSTDWIDGFIGARFSGSISNSWDWVFRGNVGSGGSDLALGLELEFRRELASGNGFIAGFRALNIDIEDSSRFAPVQLDMTFAGLTVGYTFDL